jgi:hypothetical protein
LLTSSTRHQREACQALTVVTATSLERRAQNSLIRSLHKVHGQSFAAGYAAEITFLQHTMSIAEISVFARKQIALIQKPPPG